MDNVVSARRTGRGWSQQRLADELGVTRQTVISIERGRFDPSLPLAFRIAHVFGCAIEELFFPDQQAERSASSSSGLDREEKPSGTRAQNSG